MLKRVVLISAAAALLCSCGANRELAYLTDIAGTQKLERTDTDAWRIASGTVLSIMVSSSRPELTVPFNSLNFRTAVSNGATNTQTGIVDGYMVDARGELTLPVIGAMKVDGLTAIELADSLKTRLAGVMPDPVVSVTPLNYHISVIGEVNKPGTYPVTSSGLNLFEAMALAGEMTQYGRKGNVMVIRKSPDGTTQASRLDLRSKAIFSSPCFNLQNGDIVYVEAMNAKARAVSPFNTYMPMVTSLASLATSIAMIFFYTRVKP